ncbi:DEAD/DEAH box helicase [Pseudorhodobacter sp. MZDSW-24AT]|uniref:DEAD/DEAH box helicase n=1 Tax=Pseudorhodobacter sp. MZDSW-24AT TaxID=2052957 RepID=UPI000C1DE98A|nr:DEAD/DEAH box helicase [Pseudorhodobacter sp. MZDSW-24AT]PJF09923.1 DEAD/DEAH box helicase [Pseudorhodobacter sp. MZDSW-24AT]
MIDMNVAAPLAQALEAKGYETLTAVQQSVIAEGVEGRDLLVSAQTGSGKTVAFGLAIAPEILAGSDRLLYADKPIALIVAPTRELALQVKRELEWLYGVAGAQIASCVGGMDYRTEKRALDRGAHIVVGTPGRLRDHIERGSLDLSFCRAVVLDEADEMLDLGFAEDLEFILAAAPEDRRTLMFSATVPKEIESLARTFQRDAMRIIAKGETKQHADIQYRAMSVAARDREHAIFNVLRFYDAPTAIVFCKTRMNVNHLMARMTNRGFQVVALSGELSQQERTHALQSLRDGRARVCIATDVAARGIDLPGLELVIHADLPSNSETLLHRSGRTGRAGNKGVSALIVVPAEAKKAQRLLAGAKVVADWVKAPSAEEVQAKDDQRILEHPALAEAIGEESAMVATLIERFGAEQTAAAFIRLWREGRSAPEVLSDSLPPPPASAPRERGEFGPSVWFSLSVGHSGRAEARWILPKICDGAGISKDGIGAIRVKEDVTFVQIAAPLAGRFGPQLELEPGLTMARMEGEPSLDRPERAPRPARDDRPAYKPKPSRVVEDDAIIAEAAPARKPYAKREDGERKPYAAREEKPYAPRAVAERKPYAPREGASERKPYAKRDDADRKPYTPREGGDRKPYAKREEAPAGGAKFKSAGYKSFGGGAGKPARAAGFKSHAAEGTGYKPKSDGDRAEKRTYAPKGDESRPFAKREGKPAGKSAGFKSVGADGKKPFARKSDAPARPRADAKDTSKRFVPPKGAKR